MQTTRDPSIDILRSVAIVSAIVMHFNNTVSIYAIASVPLFFQKHWLTVGDLFIFLAGVMAFRKTLQRYRKDPVATSRGLVKKGLFIGGVFYTGVIFLFMVRGLPWPGSLFGLTFGHHFLIKVLFIFGCLYLLQPAMLFVADRGRGTLYGFFVLCIVVFSSLGFLSEHLSVENRTLFLDRTLYLYPIIPSLVVMTMGMIAESHEIWDGVHVSGGGRMISPAWIGLAAGVIGVALRFGAPLNSLRIILAEGLAALSSVMLAGWFVKRFGVLRRVVGNSPILLIGKHSLKAFFFGNLLIGMISPGLSLEPGGRLFLLCVVLILTWVVAAEGWQGERAAG
jgi:hypothetical protein